MYSAGIASRFEADWRMASSLAQSEPVSSAGEERALWRSLRERGDEAARAALLVRYMPYAKMIAAMVYGRRISLTDEFDDYLQLARVGLLEAMGSYDPSAGVQFKTFAASRVRGAVLDGVALLSEQHNQAHARRQILAGRTESLAGDDGTGQGDDLFKYLADIGMGLALGFMLEDTGMFDAGGARSTGPDPLYHAVELGEARQRLHSLIESLPAPERKVIHHHYLQGVAFESIAREMSLTKGRISQIHKKALTTLRERMAERHTCDRSF
jgi:RNA polymerase sigma factor for flagellar operon FliA